MGSYSGKLANSSKGVGSGKDTPGTPSGSTTTQPAKITNSAVGGAKGSVGSK